jgi:hypothetical protein
MTSESSRRAPAAVAERLPRRVSRNLDVGVVAPPLSDAIGRVGDTFRYWRCGGGNPTVL